MKKSDWMLVAVILTISLLLIGYGFFTAGQDAGSVVVTVGGKVKGTYSLSVDQEIAIDDTNHFVIRDGVVKMDFATCPDQYCVHSRAISKNKETIICLPNQVVLEIRSEKESAYDAVVE